MSARPVHTKLESDRWLFVGLLGLLIWLPLPVGSNHPWAWAIMELWIFLLGIGWLTLTLKQKTHVTGQFLKARPALILFLLWLGYLSLQLIPLPLAWLETLSPSAAAMQTQLQGLGNDTGVIHAPLSLDPWASRSFLLKSWSYFLLFCLILLLVRSTGRIKTLVMILILSGVFQALFGSFMTLSGIEHLLFTPKSHYLGKAVGTFVNRNHYAGYLNMSLALGIGWLVAGSKTREIVHWRQRLRNLIKFLLSPKMRLRVYLAIMAIGLVLSHSRMGNSAFFASLLITGGLWLLLQRRRPQRGALIVLVSILLIDILILGHWFGIDKVVDRLENTSLQGEMRDDVISDSLPYARQYWLTGSGSGSFTSTYPGYMGEKVRAFHRYAHNDYLQFFLEVGLVGTLLVGTLVLWSLIVALRVMRRRRHSYLKRIGYGSFMGMLAILIHSSVDFNLQIPANAAYFVILLALAWVGHGFPSRRSRAGDTTTLPDASQSPG